MSRKRLLMWLVFAIITMTIIGVAVGKWSEYHRIRSNPNHVTITNLGDHSGDLQTKATGDIEASIYKRIKETTANTEPYYTATIRKGSYSKTYYKYEGDYPPSYVPLETFLVDIPKASRTYRVQFSGGPGYPYSILYVLCPQAKENTYPAFNCTDQQ